MAATAGLGVLLETTATAGHQKHQLPPRHAAAPPARTPAAQIISKANLTNAGAATDAKNVVDDAYTFSSASAFSCSSSSSSRALTPMLMPEIATAASSFLQRCFLCRRELADGRDIFIYRGDRAFCSEECRCRHILVDDDDDYPGRGGRPLPPPPATGGFVF
ncbi:unnamed protein product [Urochloa humidicola]